MIILGIETSCDETAAAIIERRPDGSGVIRANIVRSQIAEHAVYGGVVPEIAARAHVEILDILVAQALEQAGVKLPDIDAIAATAGPGLIGGLLVGVTEAKMLALAAGKPFLPVNHLEGHALMARLTDNVPYPYLLLLVSGGHTQLAAVLGPGRFKRLGTTIDDALGECFDKAAKLMGLAYPGGPAVERAAKQGRADAVALPRPLLGSKGCDFSFSGLKTAVRHAVLAQQAANAAAGGGEELTEQNIADICAGFQAAIADCAADRLTHAFSLYEELLAEEGDTGGAARPRGGMGQNPIAVSGKSTNVKTADSVPEPQIGSQAPSAPGGVARPRGGMGQSPIAVSGKNTNVKTLVVSGGVAANGALRAALSEVCAARGYRFIAPPVQFCSDNAAMIAWAGAEHWAQIEAKAPAEKAAIAAQNLDFVPRPRWPLDMEATAKIGSGRKGAKA